MVELMVVVLQFFVLAAFCKQPDIRLGALLLSALFLSDALLANYINTSFYYQRQVIQDLLMIACLWTVKDKTKWWLLASLCTLSAAMHIYEGLSYYQSIIYPYRDIIQWWMVEIMFIVLAWNCNWRGIDNVKLCRINN